MDGRVDAWAVVGDPELEELSVGDGADSYLGAVGCVCDCVLGEVEQGLGESLLVGEDDDRWCLVHVHVIETEAGETSSRVAEHIGREDGAELDV